MIFLLLDNCIAYPVIHNAVTFFEYKKNEYTVISTRVLNG